MNNSLFQSSRTTWIIALLLAGFVLLRASGALADSEVHASGLVNPIKIAMTPGGSLLVAEQGTGNNTGRLSIVDRWGNVRPLISGLPSGIEVTEAGYSGPAGVDITGCCLVTLLIGEGDAMRFDPAGPPGRQIPNPVGPVSPIFSSLLRLQLFESVEHLDGGFVLTYAQQETLADGFPVILENASGERVKIWLAAEFKDFRPETFINVRNSNPFDFALYKNSTMPVVIDSGSNSVVDIGLFHPPKTLLRFAPVPNPLPFGPPVSDAVPTSIWYWKGNKFLVTLFVGVPFPPGAASVRIVDVQDRTESTFISGLTSAMDVMRLGSRTYVLQFSQNMTAAPPLPGQLLRFADPAGPAAVVTGDLITPTAMVYSKRNNSMYITELATGLVKRVGL